jgi:hypothetical protein
MINLDNNNKYFYLSYLIIVIVNLINFYINAINPNLNLIIDIFIGLHIFFSVFFIIYKINFIYFFSQGKNKLFFILLLYCAFQFFRFPADGYDIYIRSYWLSKFGGINYDSLFLLPLFYFWSYYENSIYWFERLSLLSIKIGIYLIPICYFLNLPFFYVAFFPVYYLLAGYNYSDFKRKIWILSGFLIGNYIFFIEVHRSANFRCFFVLLILFLIYYNFKKINTIIIYILLAVPFFFLVSYFYLEQSIFLYFFEKLNLVDSIYSVDTRSFIYKDVINHFKYYGNIFIGDGGFANYFSNYFNNWRNALGMDSGDSPFRFNAEVGILGIILKGGLIFLFLIFLMIFKSVYLSNKYSKNRYTYSLAFIIASYFSFIGVENIFLFDLLNISFWIMLSITANIRLYSIEEKEMIKIFEKVNNV